MPYFFITFRLLFRLLTAFAKTFLSINEAFSSGLCLFHHSCLDFFFIFLDRYRNGEKNPFGIVGSSYCSASSVNQRDFLGCVFPAILYRRPFLFPLSRATSRYIWLTVQALSLSSTRFTLTFLGSNTIASEKRTFTLTHRIQLFIRLIRPLIGCHFGQPASFAHFRHIGAE